MGQREDRDATSGTPRKDAAELYTLCFPLLLTDAVRRAHPPALPQFLLVNADGVGLAPGLFEDDPRIVIASAWVSLTDGPVILDAPSAQGRHFVLNAVDTAGRSFLCAEVTDGLKLALVSPTWVGEVPANVVAKRAPSSSCWVVSRIHARSMFDRNETSEIVRRLSLDFVGRQEAPIAAVVPVLGPGPMMPLRETTQLSPHVLFRRLDALLGRAPVGPHYDETRRRIVALRASLEAPQDSAEWSTAFHDELARGCASAAAEIAEAAHVARSAAGEAWMLMAPFEDSEGPLERAAYAYANLGALPQQHLLCMSCRTDQFGEPLSGASAYRIRLSKGRHPPVKAFWELYARPPSAAQTRIGVSCRQDLTVSPDGAIELLVQHSLPDEPHVSNWLPSPRGAFSLILRLHLPRSAALSGEWTPPQVERLEGMKQDERGRPRTESRPWRSPLHDDPGSQFDT